MKQIFTPKDVDAGMYIIRESSPKDTLNLGFACTVTYKIGFTMGSQRKYGMCNVLTDGWFGFLHDTKEELCDYLNNDEKGFRQLTKAQYLKLLNSTEQGFY